MDTHTEYHIIVEEGTGELINSVNIAIKKGWMPQGGVGGLFIGDIQRYGFYQAMIRQGKVTITIKDKE